MFSINLKKITKISVVTIILGVMIFGYFCLNIFNHQIDMEMMNNTSAIAKNVESCCNTTFSKHLESFRSNFILPTRASDYLIAFIISIVLAFVVNLYLYNPIDNIFLLYRSYLRQNPNLLAFDSIKLALSDGILNPKVF